MTEVLYEAQDNFIFSFPIIFYVLLIAWILLVAYYICGWFKNADLAFKIFFAIAILLLTLIVGSLIYQHFDCKDKVYGEYKRGNYSTVEGYITYYEARDDDKERGFSDFFYVDNIEFFVSDHPYTGFGYTIRQAQGGVLKEGIKVKINYITYQYENVIMRLEIIK